MLADAATPLVGRVSLWLTNAMRVAYITCSN